MFGAIFLQPRYVAGYFLLFWSLLFLATGAFTTNTTRFARAAAFALVIMVLPMLRRGLIEERQLNSQQDNLNTAIAVQESGIRPGDKIAYIGDGLDAHWAKLDKLAIVAEVPSYYLTIDQDFEPVASPFWQSPEYEQAAIYDALRKTGARAILASTPSTGVPSGWQQVGPHLCAKFLR
jgi:hypothetical protein